MFRQAAKCNGIEMRQQARQWNCDEKTGCAKEWLRTALRSNGIAAACNAEHRNSDEGTGYAKE